MRDIKFRAWNWLEKRMEYLTSIIDLSHVSRYEVITNIYENSELLDFKKDPI